MQRVCIWFLVVIAVIAVCCPVYAAKQDNEAKSKPVEVKTALDPANTRVAVLAVLHSENAKKCVMEEMGPACLAARGLIIDAFTARGFQVVPDKDMPEKAPRLDAENGKGVAAALTADLVVDCYIKEYYSFDRRNFMRVVKSGVALVHLIVYGVKDGYLVNDDFVARVNGNVIMPGVSKRTSLREEALKQVIDVALGGLLQPYPLVPKPAAVAPTEVKQ